MFDNGVYVRGGSPRPEEWVSRNIVRKQTANKEVAGHDYIYAGTSIVVGLCLAILILGSYAGTLSLSFILEADSSVDMGSGSRKAGVLETKHAVGCKYLTI